MERSAESERETDRETDSQRERGRDLYSLRDKTPGRAIAQGPVPKPRGEKGLKVSPVALPM